MKKILSLLMAVFMSLTLLPSVPIYAAPESSNKPTISIENTAGSPGSQIRVSVEIQNNPGIAGGTLMLDYDQGLILTAAESGAALDELFFTKPGVLGNPATFLWDTDTGQSEQDGIMLNLTFEIDEDADLESVLGVRASYIPGDFYNEDIEAVSFQIVNGSIHVIDYTPGDVNNDGLINGKDVTLIRRYIVGGYNQSIEERAADVNEDGRISGQDVTLIRRYIIGEKGVTLKPVPPACNHELVLTAAKAATCTLPGNIAYYTCSHCGQIFADAAGTEVIDLSSARIEATGHTLVTDEAVAPTTTSTGLTEGSHCSVCHEILVPQEVVPQLKNNEYSITYYISENDAYLKNQKITNSNNPPTYNKNESVTLAEPEGKPEGYLFLGWYSSPSGGNRIEEIPEGSTGNKVLYARWEKTVYTVQFESSLMDVEPTTYTVDQGVVLPSLSWFGYTFVGWSMDGRIVTRIPPGTTGNRVVYANWTSNRNMGHAKTTLDDPEVIEDIGEGRIMFVYELGTIENVPLGEIENLGNSQGINITREFEYSESVQSGYSDKVAKAISNATTKSTSWTLSEEWNDITSTVNSHDEESSKTTGRTDSEGNVTGSRYLVSNSSGGSTVSSTEAGGSSSSSSKVIDSDSKVDADSSQQEKENKKSSNLYINGNLQIGGSIGGNIGAAKAEAHADLTVGAGGSWNTSEDEKEASQRASSRTKNNSTETNNASDSFYHSSSSASSSWNSTKSYENSSSVSHDTSISETISKAIYDRYSVSSTESRGGGNSETSSTADTQSLKDEYASTLEYSTEQKENVKKTLNFKADATGYYRIVNAGTVHVFGVVGYDIATSSYYSYTYNILDPERHEYLDYSLTTANFNDQENAVLPFEVPGFVFRYVANRTARTPGLTIDYDTGYVTDYEGTAEYVVVPSYVSINNGDGTYSFRRVRGIEPNAFRGNKSIKGVCLSDFIGEIPASAFENCSNLESVYMDGAGTIGANAFKNCGRLESVYLDQEIESIGNSAFDGVPAVTLKAKNGALADSILRSAPKSLILDISEISDTYDGRTITIPSGRTAFTLNAGGKTLKDTRIESNATKTTINSAVFTDNTRIPLDLNSPTVELNRVSVSDAPGFALVLRAAQTEISLFSTIRLVSRNDDAVLAHHVTLKKADPEVAGKLNLTGNFLTTGTVANQNLLAFTSGRLIQISDDEFTRMLETRTVRFDANGGSCSETERNVQYGHTIGTLPTPSRKNYLFSGWYTAQSGGTRVDANWTVTASQATTLYARWEAEPMTITFNGSGSDVTLNETSRTIRFGQTVGTLPSPIRPYYTFTGWYTAASGGNRVTSDFKPTSAADLILYAHWEANVISDFVPESELPANARVTESKWTYKQKETVTSSQSSMNGYTLESRTRVNWGGTQGPVYSDPSNGERNVWSEQYVTSSNTKTVYHYYRYASSFHAGNGSYTGNSTYPNKYTITLDSPINDTYTPSWSGGRLGYKYYDGQCSGYHTMFADSPYTTQEWVSDNYGTRWYYQDPVYSYTFYRLVDSESTTDPTGQSGVSDVIKWVRYQLQ